MPRCFWSGVDRGEDDRDVGVQAVGDEHLAAVEHVVVAVAPRRRAQGGGVAARLGLGQGEAAQLAAGGERCQELALLRLVAVAQERIADQRVVDREDDAARSADPGDLLDHHAVGDHVHARPAERFRDVDPGETELAGLVEEVDRELAGGVDLPGARLHHFGGEPAHGLAQQDLLFAQLDLHASPREGAGRANAAPTAMDRSSAARSAGSALDACDGANREFDRLWRGGAGSD